MAKGVLRRCNKRALRTLAVASGFALTAVSATSEVEWKDLVITEPEPVASDEGASTAGYDTRVCSSETTSESVDITPSGLFIVVE